MPSTANTFTATANYYVMTPSGPLLNDISGGTRIFDFIIPKASNKILNNSGSASFSTFQSNGNTRGTFYMENTAPDGVNPGLVYNAAEPAWDITYTAGEAFTANACRTFVNTNAVPTFTPIRVEFYFKLRAGWPFESTYDSAFGGRQNTEALIWQFKCTTAVGGPFLALYVGTPATGGSKIYLAYASDGGGGTRTIIATINSPTTAVEYQMVLNLSLIGPYNRIVGTLGGQVVDYTPPGGNKIWASTDSYFYALMAMGVYCYNNDPTAWKNGNSATPYLNITNGLPMDNPNNCQTRTIGVTRARLSTLSNDLDLRPTVARRVRP